MELWAGVECSVCRIGDNYYDQMAESGHADRLQDLDLVAELGVRTIRYPVLWERVAPDGIERADWTWPDGRLTRLRQLRAAPSLALSTTAAARGIQALFNRRSPRNWLSLPAGWRTAIPGWMPIHRSTNPSRRRDSAASTDTGTHMAAIRSPLDTPLLNECKAVVLAMRAIRDVNSTARLVQTEDLGKTLSTRALAYQADFENSAAGSPGTFCVAASIATTPCGISSAGSALASQSSPGSSTTHARLT